MSIAKKLFAVVDTETATLNGEVFDFGMMIVDKDGNEYARYQALCKEVFENDVVMAGAFYHEKVDTFYRPLIRLGMLQLKPWKQICEEVAAITSQFENLHAVAAYNLAFDKRVIRATGKKYGFVPMFKAGILELDLWRVACETLLQQKTYKQLAESMGWVSPAGNIRTNAEKAFAYGFGDWEFKESHTALDDALIESRLLARMFGLKQKINYGIIGHPWRLVNCKD